MPNQKYNLNPFSRPFFDERKDPPTKKIFTWLHIIKKIYIILFLCKTL